VTAGASAPTRPTARYVEHVMGMPISLALRGRHAPDDAGRAAWADLMARLRAVDEVFSTYRPDSVISRLDRGELTLADGGGGLAHGSRHRRDRGVRPWSVGRGVAGEPARAGWPGGLGGRIDGGRGQDGRRVTEGQTTLRYAERRSSRVCSRRSTGWSGGKGRAVAGGATA
jgi:hypothetical protein